MQESLLKRGDGSCGKEAAVAGSADVCGVFWKRNPKSRKENNPNSEIEGNDEGRWVGELHGVGAHRCGR